ncbi:unnamed protein product [Echinostoma caproni]|uniref:NR LBD domain-containing protein n=1 Tax=Echinostoma caproni TaxID=27848 RepID=A0A183AAA8_9TREM|nr:unnamed protein product [Echinostoma caproni]
MFRKRGALKLVFNRFQHQTPLPYLVSTHTGEVFEAVPVSGVPSEFGYITLVPSSMMSHLPNGMMGAPPGYGLSENPSVCAPISDHPTESISNRFHQTTFPPGSHNDPTTAGFTQFAQEQNMMHLNYITDWRRRCDDEAQEMVSRIKQSQNLSDHRMLGQTLACTEDLLKEIRLGLHPSNVKCFELSVEHFISQLVSAVTTSYHARGQPAAYPNSMLVSYPHVENMSCM